ncbi:FAD-dependent oxidoreductase [Parapedobacter indicus]|uniref:FAD dependent oxidoreductase n=1 Tax=Parapedobacter indicus TaxID=1477437 RepID=A0A1I3PKG6_9SPHI|nr:FAD-dependent oxidoreductase [Parapedobacter indicus]PPL00492.1 FAD dependent oxidoreductase [Parapedobacter indicus]SFJ22184.1 FAD dependent oxidoreductase [Parapedobacter indicus]
MKLPRRVTAKYLLILFSFAAWSLHTLAQTQLLVEAESFDNTGGWVIDQQSFPVIQSSYLMAHGMGRPVEDATTTAHFEKTGTYHLWVRTKDWAPFPKGPGRFEVIVNGEPLGGVFGESGVAGWKWYYGGEVDITNVDAEIRLKDLSGFNGRCDALLFSTSKAEPPQDSVGMSNLRKTLLDLDGTRKEAGHFDLVVVGGGVAGTCAAVVAARLGLKVALIQDRPVLGGNNSSEVRVHLRGDIDKNHHPKLGRVVRELDNGDPGNGHPDGLQYGDQRKMDIINYEKNITLYLNTHVYQVEMKDKNISAVIGRDIRTNKEVRFTGSFFSDCTGDGTVGYLAGANYRMGRESKVETGESLAAEKTDDFTLGTSNLWASLPVDSVTDFPQTPWALPFSDEYHIDEERSDWQWETGFGNLNTIAQAEEIRDHNLRAVYGNWSYLKNNKAEKYGKRELAWVAYIGGKRESRRLMGDHILTQMDIQDGKMYPDATVTATWTIDLHFPQKENSLYFPGEEFFASTKHIRVAPYTIPYRCLYSRNIPNLFMAGRNISTTHVAFGSTRVMRTCGMMGEVVGMAAYVAKKNETNPRGVYERHLDDLLDMVRD